MVNGTFGLSKEDIEKIVDDSFKNRELTLDTLKEAIATAIIKNNEVFQSEMIQSSQIGIDKLCQSIKTGL